MRKVIKFSLIISIVIIIILSIAGCSKEQITLEQTNTTMPIRAWQDLNGNLHIEVSNTGSNNVVEVSWSGDADTWKFWTEDQIYSSTYATYSELEAFIGEEISIFSRNPSYNNEDGSILYNASSKSDALVYTVKEAWDKDSTDYKNAVELGETVNSQGEYYHNVPLTGEWTDLDSWCYMLQDDPTIYHRSNIWYYDSAEDNIFIKKLNIVSGNYTLSDLSLDYEYYYTDPSDTFTINNSKTWVSYNKTTGIPVLSNNVIILRVAETESKCCSDIILLDPFWRNN